jgi:hypothetical protein
LRVEKPEPLRQGKKSPHPDTQRSREALEVAEKTRITPKASGSCAHKYSKFARPSSRQHL